MRTIASRCSTPPRRFDRSPSRTVLDPVPLGAGELLPRPLDGIENIGRSQIPDRVDVRQVDAREPDVAYLAEVEFDGAKRGELLDRLAARHEKGGREKERKRPRTTETGPGHGYLVAGFVRRHNTGGSCLPPPER